MPVDRSAESDMTEETTFDEEVADLLTRLDMVEEQARSLGATPPEAADVVVGESPGAQENRTLRSGRAVLAQQLAGEVAQTLEEIRRRAVAMAEHARAATARSRSARGRDTMDPVARDQVSESLDRAARSLLVPGDEEHAVEHVLARIAAAALAAVPGADRVGISLLAKDGSVTSHAPSDDLVAELDRLQSTLDEGPCRDAIAHREHFLVEDMAAQSGRWPRFADAAAARGVRSMLSFPLFANHDGTAGALNLYGDRLAAFDAASLDVGSLYASHAAIALHGAQRVAGLTEALRSRDVIGQAKGVLLERFGLGGEQQAFTMLVTSSQETNLKLREVAQWVVDDAVRRASSSGR